MDGAELVLLARAAGLEVRGVLLEEPKPAKASGRTRGGDLVRRLGLEVDNGALPKPKVTRRLPAHVPVTKVAGDSDARPAELFVRLTVASDLSAYWRLWSCLRYQAGKLAERQRWRPQVRRRRSGELHFYLDELARLVLDADRHAAIFAAVPGLHAVYLDVDDQPTWHGELEPRYAALQRVYRRWCEEGLEQVRRAIFA
jgi:hypothetical protein